MKKFGNITRENLVSPLIVTGLVYLIGLISNLIFEYGLIIDGLQNTPVFPLASTISLISVAMFWIISGPFTVKKYFTLSISMSTTREKYILSESFQTVLGSLILYIICFLLFQLEDRILIPLCYSGFPRESELPFFTTLFGSFSSAIFWGLAFAAIVLGIRLFLGSLLIRFGQIIYWILWGIWMCASIFLSSMDSEKMASLEHHIDYAGSLLHGHFIPLLCCAAGIIISCIGVCLLKKQDVRYI